MELHAIDYKVPGGKLIRLKAKLDGDKIRSVTITGDFFLHPEDRIFEMEKALAGAPLDPQPLRTILNKVLADCQMAGISAEELVNALMRLRQGTFPMQPPG